MIVNNKHYDIKYCCNSKYCNSKYTIVINTMVNISK